MHIEYKFIIAKVDNKLRHFKSDREDHLIIARNNHIPEVDIIEKGFISDFLQVWECYDKKHLLKLKTKTPGKWLGFDVDDYERTLKREWWRK